MRSLRNEAAMCQHFVVWQTVQVVARSKADILAARGVKPTLSPNLDVLATVEALDVKRLLFIGVGCQVFISTPVSGPTDHHRLYFTYFWYSTLHMCVRGQQIDSHLTC